MAVLGVLKEHEAHGYELKKPMAELPAGPAVLGRRDEKRNRKVYGITDKGETRLRELLANADPSDDRAFHVQVAFCCFLEPTPGSAFRAAAGPPRPSSWPSAAGPRTSEHRPLPPLSQGARHRPP